MFQALELNRRRLPLSKVHQHLRMIRRAGNMLVGLCGTAGDEDGPPD
jgi:hypothetical protein